MRGSTKFSVSTAQTQTANATQVAPGAGYRLLISDIAASSDKPGAVVKIIQDIASTPVTLFELQTGTPVGYFAHRFGQPIQVEANKTATVQIHGVAVCKANIVGEITSH